MNTKTPPGAAIVTGASRGLGFGIAQQLADAGHPVVLVARGADELDRATAAIRDAGREALAIQADVTREEDVENLAAVTLERFGPPEVLVNNAGALPVLGTLDDLTWDLFARGIDVDVRGTFNATRAVAAAMRAEGRGTIVNLVASAAGTIFSPEHTAQSSSQAALHALTRCAASWLAPAGVTVHSLCPRLTLAGGVGKAAATGFGAAEEITAEEWIERRLGTETLTPAQVGDAVIALLESESGTWSVTPAGLEEWDPIAAPVVPR
jgi:3-oxoacyl-[acyl-carrier protein] reductase